MSNLVRNLQDHNPVAILLMVIVPGIFMSNYHARLKISVVILSNESIIMALTGDIMLNTRECIMSILIGIYI